MARRLLWASLALAPITILIDARCAPEQDAPLRARSLRADPARVVDRRSDRAGRRAHGPAHRRSPQRELRQRAGGDHRVHRCRRQSARRRARLDGRQRHLEHPARARRGPGSRPGLAARSALAAQPARARVRRRPAAADSLGTGLARRSEPALARAAQHRPRGRAARALPLRDDPRAATARAAREHGGSRLEPARRARGARPSPLS